MASPPPPSNEEGNSPRHLARTPGQLLFPFPEGFPLGLRGSSPRLTLPPDLRCSLLPVERLPLSRLALEKIALASGGDALLEGPFALAAVFSGLFLELESSPIREVLGVLPRGLAF